MAPDPTLSGILKSLRDKLAKTRDGRKRNATVKAILDEVTNQLCYMANNGVPFDLRQWALRNETDIRFWANCIQPNRKEVMVEIEKRLKQWDWKIKMYEERGL